MKKNKIAYSLAEILITFTLLGVVAVIVMTSVMKTYSKKMFVTRLLVNYAKIESATVQWQVEQNCAGNIKKCFNVFRSRGITINNTVDAFSGIASKLNVVETYSWPKDCGGGLPDWLTTEPGTMYNGGQQAYYWMGASTGVRGCEAGAWYLLKDGSVLFVQFPDNVQQSGFGFIDVNGTKKPNRIGIDVFPIGWGARNNNNKDYSGMHPYFAEDQWGGGATKQNASGETVSCSSYHEGYNAAKDTENNNKCSVSWWGHQFAGLCKVSGNNYRCSPDDGMSPTAYVLKYKKLPQIDD